MKIYLSGALAREKDVYSVIDEEDAILTLTLWSYNPINGYAQGQWPRGSMNRPRYMHRVILERVLSRRLTRGERVDHINRDKLDNRRANLRLATHQQNKQNTGKQSGKHGSQTTSQYKGVSRDKTRNKWVATIFANKKTIHLGRFEDEIEAARAYDAAAIKYFGEFANPNFR